MLVFYIILLLLGLAVGGPLGLAAAGIIVLIMKILGGIGSSITKGQEKRNHDLNHTKCPKCQNEVNIEATVCMHCRSELEPDEYRIKARDKYKSPWQ